MAIGALSIVAACSPENPTLSNGSATWSTQGSARQILSFGKILRLGSTDVQSSPEERVGWSRFAHDYWLDTTEVTQAEYRNLTGRNPAPVAARGQDKPVVNVTWFDAILFCNARSKRDHLDTVYEYSAVSADSTGSVRALGALTSHMDRNGWRLPSEAEWEYAARAGSTAAYMWGELADSAKAVEFAWFQKNAGASLHDAAKLKPNAWGIYDMAGNVMEWVQDWKGFFPKDTVTDFVGPDAPPDIPEAPLKGGAYTYGVEHLRPSSRTSTYAAYRSDRTEYVGFRCARGGFTATYTNASGQSVQAPPVSILRSDVARYLGARSARLVFLNRSNGKGILSWIDYGDATPVVRSFPGKDPVFHPVISPDGNWVAWCTVLEGSTGTSRIKVRRLAKNDSMVLDLGTGAIPRWWVDGTDTFLVRVSSAIDNIDSDWASGQTIAQRWSNGSLVDAARTWSSAGSYHDGRSGQYLYTGYKRLKQYDVSGKTSRTLFAYPRNGKDVGDTSQACNVSTAPDGSGRVMFLDFGYPGRSDVVGRPYGIHEVAFMADSTGAILQTFPVASGKSQWNHLEWSNHPGWAVGMALDGEFHHEIHLLDLNTGKATPIVSGADLGMPVLWVGTEELAALRGGVDPDSCGAYDQKANEESIGAYASAISSEYAAKIPLFWQSKDSLQVMFFGSSRSGRGFLPSELKTGKSFNFAAISTELFTCEKLISNYVIPNAKQLRLVVLDVIPGWFDLYDGDSIGYYSWKTISNSVGYKYDSSHGFWKNGLPDGYLGVLQSKGEAAKNWFAPVGEIHAESGGWSKSPQIVTYDSLLLVKKPGFKKNMALLRGLISKLKTQNINMLMVNFPVNPHYKEMGICDLYGPSCAVYHEVIDSIASLGKENGNFKLFDANLNGSHDYDSFEFSDDSHLSYLGAKKMTSRVDSILINWRE